MRNAIAISLVVSVCLAGCGSSTNPTKSTGANYQSDDMDYGGEAEPFPREAELAGDETASLADLPEGVPRKIIYQATLALVVDDFSSLESEIPKLIESHSAYLASANLARNRGAQRSGKWTVRVPVEQYEAFLDQVTALGIPERREQTSQDVTMEYIDLEARIAAKKKLETRILKLLDDRSGKIKDVIDVERELSRVRSDIEQMEGRIRYLAKQSSLTTVTIHAREEADYHPPEAPGFGGRLAGTFSSSAGTLGSAIERLVMVVVACVPWVLMIGVVATPIWFWRRS